MESDPVIINDEFTNKQNNKYLSPIRGGSDVVYKSFKYSLNHNDKERFEVDIFIFIYLA
jgi:hypothetical protein